jgi:hypothetical protein
VLQPAAQPILNNPLRDVAEYIDVALTQYSHIFVASGWSIFRALAIISLAWFGIQTAFTAAEGSRGFQISRLVRLLLLISLVYVMVGYYVTPIPGVGFSFREVGTAQANWIVQQLQSQAVSEVNAAIDAAWSRVGPPPSPLNFTAVLLYVLFYALMTGVRFAVFYVTAFGMIATAVVSLVGPLFIPFLLIPKLDWLFWGWVRSLLQYAFYRVIAEVYVFIWSGFLLRFLAGFRDFDEVRVGSYGLLVFMVLIAFIFGALQIASLTASIFSGRAGESAINFR